MGKSLIIKGADFSANGFKYQEEVTDASTLYIKNNVVLTSENYATLSSSTEGLMAYEKTNGDFIGNSSIVAYTATAKADCSGFDVVRVKVRNNVNKQSTIQGVALLLFTDENGEILGGYTTMPENDTSPSGVTTGAGNNTELRTFEMNVPAGAKYVYSTYQGTASVTPFTSGSEFEMKLVKMSLS